MSTSDVESSEEARAEARRRRSDAEENHQRLLDAAVRVLHDDPDATLDAIAQAAGLGRATAYRHFGGRRELVTAARRHAQDLEGAGSSEGSGARASEPGPRPQERAPEAARGSVFLEVADVLDQVPPHLLAEQVVAEAQRVSGAAPVALYLVDIDGSRLLRTAGSQEFPAELPAPLAVGPELPEPAVHELRKIVQEELPGSVLAPLDLRGRALGILLAVRASPAPLARLAREAAAALELARVHTDVLDVSRRRKETSAAAEVQQAMLPPRVVRVAGASLAGNVLPSYDVGGDWFDYVENPAGTWLGIADAAGTGPAAAALAALALGAFRAARRSDRDLRGIVAAMDAAILEAGLPGGTVAVTIARWHGASSTLSWINRGNPRPLRVDAAGEVEVLGASHAALGIVAGDELPVERLRVAPGERVVLASDGILERTTARGGPFGPAGVRDAVARATGTSAASTVKAIEAAVAASAPGRLEDDATLIVLAAADAGPA